MGLFTWKIHIDAPPQAVFDALADVPNHSSWADDKSQLKIMPVSGGPSALGSKYLSEQIFFGKKNSADLEIVGFDPPRRFALAISQRPDGRERDDHLTHTFTLTPDGTGTMLQRDTTGDGNPLLGLIAFPAIKKNGYDSLKKLKAKLESSNTG
jgi:uncharacterized protein YndB with AHSA1/START domain